jgi:hypothetical protein
MNHLTPRKPTDDKNPNHHEALQHAFDATAVEPDQAALDRLMRHTRHVSASPARASHNWRWLWWAGPAVAGATAAAMFLGTPATVEPTGSPEVFAVAADPIAVEVALAEALAETDGEDVPNGAAAAGELLATFEGDALSDDPLALVGALDELDEDEVEAWIAAFDAALAEG